MLFTQNIMTFLLASALFFMPIAQPNPPQTLGSGCGTICSLSCSGSSGSNVAYRMCYNACMDICENPSM